MLQKRRRGSSVTEDRVKKSPRKESHPNPIMELRPTPSGSLTPSGSDANIEGVHLGSWSGPAHSLTGTPPPSISNHTEENDGPMYAAVFYIFYYFSFLERTSLMESIIQATIHRLCSEKHGKQLLGQLRDPGASPFTVDPSSHPGAGD